MSVSLGEEGGHGGAAGRDLPRRLDRRAERNYNVITMKTKLVRIGNSTGVRIPRALLAETGLGEDVELVAEGGTILIRPLRRPRDGWREAAAEAVAARQGPHVDGDGMGLTRFDEDEWSW